MKGGDVLCCHIVWIAPTDGIATAARANYLALIP